MSRMVLVASSVPCTEAPVCASGLSPVLVPRALVRVFCSSATATTWALPPLSSSLLLKQHYGVGSVMESKIVSISVDCSKLVSGLESWTCSFMGVLAMAMAEMMWRLKII